MLKYLVLWLVLCFCPILLQAQVEEHVLVLQKGGNDKTRLIYEAGESIRYMTADYDYYFSDVIVEIREDIIVMKENVLFPQDITAIDIRSKDKRNHTLGNLNKILLGGGVMLLVADGINSLYQEGSFGIDKSVGWIAGSMIAGGLAFTQVRYKVFRQKGKRRIFIHTRKREKE